MTVGITIAVIIFLFIASSVRILREYERAVIFRLGKLSKAVLNPGGEGNGPGFVLLIPIIDRMVKVSLRTIVHDVAPQDVITRDNVSIQVNAVVYFRVIDPEKAIVDVENFNLATSQLSQTTLRSIVGQVELDELLAQRDKINKQLQEIIDRHSDPWGVKVSLVEIKHIDLPIEMKRVMARQAEAERERRSKVINAEGEYQAATKLQMAAEIIDKYPVAVQLRFLQTLTEIASENNSTTIFPMPIDLFSPFIEALKEGAQKKKS